MFSRSLSYNDDNRGLRASKRLNDREGQLGQILQVSGKQHTVEWILGGKIAGVRREQLVYTTPPTEEGGRSQRKRKQPTSFMEDAEKLDQAKKKHRMDREEAAAAKAKAKKPKATKSAAKPAKPAAKPAKPAAKPAKPAAKPAKVAKKPAKVIKPAKAVSGKKSTPPAKKNAKSPKSSSSSKGATTTKKTAPPTKKLVTKKTAPPVKKACVKEPPAQKKKRKLQEEAKAPELATATVMALYERHRREFERILTRLEKVDKFGYFLDEQVPSEFDETLPPGDNQDQPSETYEDENDVPPVDTPMPLSSSQPNEGKKDTSPLVDGGKNEEESPIRSSRTTGSSPVTSSLDVLADQEHTASSHVHDPNKQSTGKIDPKKDKPSSDQKKEAPPGSTGPDFPSHPPYNWKMVRRRMELGRYVVDREKQEEDERFQVLGPYYQTLGKRRPRRKVGGSAKKKAAKPNPRVLHPKGVNWDLFRDDVLGMCDAAIARGDEEDDSSKISLTISANKIKEVCITLFVLVSFFIIGIPSSTRIFILFRLSCKPTKEQGVVTFQR
jgi:hypothetical protein